MRPAEFTPDAIIEAGQALQATGRNITGFALRQKVGGGNPNRLKQVWDEHLARQSVVRSEPVAELPVEVAEEVAAVTRALTDRLAALAVELNDKAVKASERRVAEIVRAAGEQREQAERELADASMTVEDLEGRLDQLVAEVGALKTRLADEQAVRQSQAVELAQMRECLMQAERAAQACAVQHAAALTEARQVAREAEAERDRARAELARAQGRAEVAEQAHQEQRQQAAVDAQRLIDRLAHAEADREAAREEAVQAREEAARLAGQLRAHQEQTAPWLARLAPPAQPGIAPESPHA